MSSKDWYWRKWLSFVKCFEFFGLVRSFRRPLVAEPKSVVSGLNWITTYSFLFHFVFLLTRVSMLWSSSFLEFSSFCSLCLLRILISVILVIFNIFLYSQSFYIFFISSVFFRIFASTLSFTLFCSFFFVLYLFSLIFTSLSSRFVFTFLFSRFFVFFFSFVYSLFSLSSQVWIWRKCLSSSKCFKLFDNCHLENLQLQQIRLILSYNNKMYRGQFEVNRIKMWLWWRLY